MAALYVHKKQLFGLLFGLVVIAVVVYFAKSPRSQGTMNGTFSTGSFSSAATTSNLNTDTEPLFQRKLNRIGNGQDHFCLVSYNILKDSVLNPGRYLPLPGEENRKGTDLNSPRHRQFMKEVYDTICTGKNKKPEKAKPGR